jgi:Rne/Rng family ribonuclease
VCGQEFQMSSILVINAAGRETRVALVENGHIAEFYLERKKDKGIVGNIYKGRVVRVLPGMQAAFVDIGLEKAAFLYVTDVVYDPDFAKAQFEMTEGEHDDDIPDVPDIEAVEEHAADLEESGPVAERAELETSPPMVETVELSGADVLNALSPPTGAPSLVTPGSPEAIAALAWASRNADTPEPKVDALSVEPAPPRAEPREARGERRAPRDQRPRERHQKRRAREEEKDGARDREREKEKPRKTARIEDLLKVGQEVVVQASKDPIGTKGARLTSHISIPGRHLVFMPTVDHIGISRRISNEKERRRLREVVERLRPPGTGFIVRTVAENVPEEKLESDIRFLIGVWNEVVRFNEKRRGPGLLHPDLDLILRATRDLFAQDVEKLVVDEREEYERIQRFVEAQDPSLGDRVVLHDNEEPIFDAYGIEQELKRATQRKVWLKSGGYIIIDQAEALTAIDVNSGRYVGKKSLEETITKINVEAAKELVYQLRLRNIGGIIICDFIDMEKPQNRDKVFKTLQEALGRDKAKTNVLRISELGLVEMTRKRVRESIGRMLHEDCSYCDGKGYVKTVTTVCYEIFREIRREALAYKEPVLIVNCHQDVARVLQGEERQELRHLMDRYNKSIQVRAQQNYHREQFDIYGRPAQQSDRPMGGPGQVGEPDRPWAGDRRPGGNRSGGERAQERSGAERGGRPERAPPARVEFPAPAPAVSAPAAPPTQSSSEVAPMEPLPRGGSSD